MRIAIDYNIDRDEVALISEVADNSCMESCINFDTTKSDSVTVYFEQNGKTVETVIPVTHCAACYVLDDTAMRTAGEFTVCAEGATPLRFVVEKEIAAGAEYSVNLAYGAFYVKCQATNNSGWIRPKITLERLAYGVLITVEDADGIQTAMVYDGAGGTTGDYEFNCSFRVDENGDLICTYYEYTAPRFSVNAEGCLIYTYDDGSEAPILSIDDDGYLIYTTEE